MFDLSGDLGALADNSCGYIIERCLLFSANLILRNEIGFVMDVGRTMCFRARILVRKCNSLTARC